MVSGTMGRAAGSPLPHVEASLVTASFWTVNPRRMVPVRVSLGVPKTLAYEPVEWPVTYPWGLLGITDRDEFEARYLARLEVQRDRILRGLAEIRESYLGWPVALVCWEDLRRPGSWCHRRMVAARLTAWLGEEVVELD
jgi:hypothetical protein